MITSKVKPWEVSLLEDEVITRAVGVLAAERGREEDPYKAAQIEYASDALRNAARELVDAINNCEDQPVGWESPLRSDYDDLALRVRHWHMRRFPDAQAPHVALKLTEEAGEVASAILGEWGGQSATGEGNLMEEAADVVIALMALVGRWYPAGDLLGEVAKKVEKLETPGQHRASFEMKSGTLYIQADPALPF